jgi:hypothetical protein
MNTGMQWMCQLQSRHKIIQNYMQGNCLSKKITETNHLLQSSSDNSLHYGGFQVCSSCLSIYLSISYIIYIYIYVYVYTHTRGHSGLISYSFSNINQSLNHVKVFDHKIIQAGETSQVPPKKFSGWILWNNYIESHLTADY